MNNFEKIKHMSIDEMADFIKHCDCETSCAFEVSCWYGDKDCDCTDGIKQWLESEVEKIMSEKDDFLTNMQLVKEGKLVCKQKKCRFYNNCDNYNCSYLELAENNGLKAESEVEK